MNPNRSARARGGVGRAFPSASSFAIAALGALLVGCASGSKTACEGKVLFLGDREFSFNENEETLLCGDEDRKDPEKREETDGWRRVPFSQREFLLRKYLNLRGYHHSSIVYANDRLEVDPGARSRIFDVKFSGVPDAFFDIGYVGWRSALLQSSSLDDIEGWTLKRLHSIGYPCAKLKTLANADTDIVTVDVVPGPKQFFPEPGYGEERPLSEHVMRRYDAFRPGELYDERLLALTSSRMGQDGVVFKSYFTPSCGEEPFRVTHRVSVGEPRLLRAGIGASTEEYVFAKASWRHGRLGKNASKFTVDVRFSALQQSLGLGFDWYFDSAHPRTYLSNQIDAPRRVREKNQEYDQYSATSQLAKRFDFTSGTLTAKGGPRYLFENTFKGFGLGGKAFYMIETEWQFANYPYQIYASEPREGDEILLATSSIAKSRYTAGGAHRIRIEGTKLLNIGNFDPPRKVAGLRYGISTILTNGDHDTVDNLPSDFYGFLGGERNVRGFGRQELPLGGRRTLTTAFLGFEYRVPAMLPTGFDPFFLFDAGWIGGKNFGFEPATYYSPGLGLRWQSPVGALRVTAAHGFIAGPAPFAENDAEHFQFFVSLGQEF